jgi:hypothetical protein
MKPIFFIVVIAATLTTVTSCNSKEQKDAQENNAAKKDDQSKASVPSATIPQGMESIIGEWQLVKFISDKNGNSKIDPEEESAAKLDQPDYLNLKADGTCEFTTVKMPARYVIETEAEDVGKKLTMYELTGPEITGLTRYIMSVSDKELVIYRVKDSFEIFRRL